MTEAAISPEQQHKADTQTLTVLNEGYVRAVGHSDVDWFEDHLAADFLNGNPDGTQSTRSQFLQQIAKPCPVRQLRAEDVRIRLFGDTAIIRACTTFLSPDGQSGSGRYTDIWIRSLGRWQCVSADVRRN